MTLEIQIERVTENVLPSETEVQHISKSHLGKASIKNTYKLRSCLQTGGGRGLSYVATIFLIFFFI